MANICEVCGKTTASGNNVPFNRSHTGVRTRRKWKPNIQTVKALVKGEVVRINTCTRCLRSGKVERA